MAHPSGHHGGLPHLIAWEVTRSCPLKCRHCRASATAEARAGEFSTDECRRLLDNIASFAKPIIILTGGEPMLRADIYDIAKYAVGLGLPTVMAPCGLLVNDDSARRIVDCGIRRISLSLDGARPETHDAFRGRAGSFQAVMDAVKSARSAGLDFQINTTISRHNIGELAELLELAVRLGASVFNPFLLVPTGRGKSLIDLELSPGQYEEVLGWLASQQGRPDIQIRVTCAPHYQRILRQSGRASLAGHGRGCMGGKGFAFISHVGKVQICGFLDIECGDVRAAGFDFRRIWETSPVLLKMRDVDGYGGRCGRCEFRNVCGGCRARAQAVSGNAYAEEPFCTYQPRGADSGMGVSPMSRGCRGLRSEAEQPRRTQPAPHELTDDEKKIISVIQDQFPINRQPWRVLGERLGMSAGSVLQAVRELTQAGMIRRIGAIFDARRLGYVSTLVAGKVAPDRLDEAAAIVSASPGVTHNYSRRHAYNLWFTLSAPSEADLDSTLSDLRARTGVDLFSLPALAMYKARAVFEAEEAHGRDARATNDHAGNAPVSLDERQRAMVRLLQGNLPLVDDPFDALAGRGGVDAEALVAQARDWLSAGVIRRFGAIVAHRKLGFVANGMAVFAVEPERRDEVGRRLAQEAEISHVYARPALGDWPYTLFAMAHGRREEEVRQLIDRLAAELTINTFNILFSTKEYKKTSMEFFIEH